MKMTSVRDQTLFANTLVCLLKSLEGKHTTIELRNENSVMGTIDHVDRMMNTTLTDATFTTITGNVSKCDHFYVQGKNIRYVHIPDEVNIMQAIKSQIRMFQKKRTQKEGNKKNVGKKSRMKEALMKQMEKMQAALAQAQKDNEAGVVKEVRGKEGETVGDGTEK